MQGSITTEEPGRLYAFKSPLQPGNYFELPPRNVPLDSKPILDDESGMCIGHSVMQAPGLQRIYDSSGIFIRLEEAPLETPLIDPTDIALLAFGAFRLIRLGKALLESGVKAAARVELSQATINCFVGGSKWVFPRAVLK